MEPFGRLWFGTHHLFQVSLEKEVGVEMEVLPYSKLVVICVNVGKKSSMKGPILSVHL